MNPTPTGIPKVAEPVLHNGSRCRRHQVWQAAVLLWLATLHGCGWMSPDFAYFRQAREAFDGAVDLTVSADGVESLGFRDSPDKLDWILRNENPLGWLAVFGSFGRGPVEEERPARYVRVLMDEMIRSAEGDLLRTIEAVERLALVLDVDDAPIDRVIALNGIIRLVSALPEFSIDVLEANDALGLVAPTDSLLASAAAGFAELRPSLRGDRLSEEARWRYAEALRVLTETRPWSVDGRQRRILLGTLRGAWLREGDVGLREEALDAMLRTLELMVSRTLWAHAVGGELAPGDGVERANLEGGPEGVALQTAAILGLVRLGGPDTVPWIVTRLRRPARLVSAGFPEYSGEPDVLRLMVNLCGQLDPERAVRRVRVSSGRAVARSPVDFLMHVINEPPEFEPGMQQVALSALAICLQRPEGVDYDPRWARDWYLKHQLERSRR